MKTNWKYVKPLDSADAVIDFTKRYNVSLPKNLIKILTDYNGGRPSDKEICTVNGDEYVFKSLLSYNKTDKETIYSFYPKLFKETTLYPIGFESSGSFVCYDTKKKRYVVKNHETDEEELITEIPFIS